MKVLTLRQPWASLVVTEDPRTVRQLGIKTIETRAWCPSPKNHAEIVKNGMLIHASAKFLPQDQELRLQEPFYGYYDILDMPLGMIIGWVKVGRIVPTEDACTLANCGAEWFKITNEYKFGDYTPGRWAWELKEPIPFKKPIPARGMLNLWDYNEPLNLREQ